MVRRFLRRKIIMAMALVLVSSHKGMADTPERGSLRVLVVDSQGQPVPEAPIYLTDVRSGRLLGMFRATDGVRMLEPGTYRLSSCWTRRQGSVFDRFASHDVRVDVVGGDQTSAILTLYPLPPMIRPVSYQTLLRRGLDPARGRAWQ